jgi:acyl carrier protein
MDSLALVQRVFREVLDNDELKLSAASTPMTVEGWDSVAQVKIIIAIEGELGVQFRTEDVSAAKSVAHLLAMIERHAP